MLISRILCPTDFSDCSQAALPIACSLARDYGASLVLVHVRPAPEMIMGEFGSLPTPPMEPVESLMMRWRQLVPAEIASRVTTEIRDGNVADEILHAARESNCELIVLSTHGRSGLDRLLVGSVAESVLRKAICPVLTIKAPAPKSKLEPLRTAEPVQPPATEAELDSNDLVTVRTSANSLETEIIRNALKGEGIATFAEGSQQAGLVGVMNFPIKIQVRVGDFDRANKLLTAVETHRH